jgi:hypothetical protein
MGSLSDATLKTATWIFPLKNSKFEINLELGLSKIQFRIFAATEILKLTRHSPMPLGNGEWEAAVLYPGRDYRH